MKYFTLAIILLLTTQLMGQITEQKAALSLGEHNCFVTVYKDAEKKMVEKAVENAIKEYGKVKRNRKANEWNCLQCKVPGMSGLTNVYFKVEEGKGQISSYIFFDDGLQFINSENNPEASALVTKSLKYIGYDVSKQVITKELEREEDMLKDRNKEQKKLEDKNKDLHEDIEEYKRKISEAEKNIEKNLQEQEDKKMEIEKQSRVIQNVTDKLNNVGKM